MAQWWEQSPPTNVARVRFPDMWVEFVVGSLLCSERFFFGYSGFPFSLKTNISKFRFDPGMHGHFWTSSCELLGAPWVNKLHLHFFKNLFQLFTLKGTAKFPLPTFWEWTPWGTKTSLKVRQASPSFLFGSTPWNYWSFVWALTEKIALLDKERFYMYFLPQPFSNQKNKIWCVQTAWIAIN